MQFQIPQFIEVEDKIVGPLTLKQFIYLAIAAGFIFLLFFILNFTLWIGFSVFIAAAGLAMAFGKYNGRPLAKIGWLALIYFWKPRLYLWQRESEYREVEIKGKKFEALTAMPNIKKLWQDLMTTKTPIPKREKAVRMPGWEKVPEEKFQVLRKLTGEKEVARRIDYR